MTKPNAWEQRWHPLREEWVIIAAHRQDRPWHGERVGAARPLRHPFRNTLPIAICVPAIPASVAPAIAIIAGSMFSITTTLASALTFR
jgi:hypothetical protein